MKGVNDEEQYQQSHGYGCADKSLTSQVGLLLSNLSLFLLRLINYSQFGCIFLASLFTHGIEQGNQFVGHLQSPLVTPQMALSLELSTQYASKVLHGILRLVVHIERIRGLERCNHLIPFS